MMRRGFTLVELLVVIAILAVLSGMLVPVLHRARGSARSSACSSNLKQIAMAAKQYTTDYDGQWVPYIWYWVPGVGAPTWMEMQDPYAKNTQVYLCASASETPSEYGYTGAANRVASSYCYPGWVPYSYYNWYGTVMFAGFPVGGGYTGSVPAWGYRASIEDSVHPAQAAFVVEGGVFTYDPVPALKFGSMATSYFGTNPRDQVYYRHNDGMNVAYCDGHVKWVGGVDFMTNNSVRTGGTYAGVPASPYMWHGN